MKALFNASYEALEGLIRPCLMSLLIIGASYKALFNASYNIHIGKDCLVFDFKQALGFIKPFKALHGRAAS